MTEHRARPGRRLLGEILVEQGWVDAADLRQALADQAPLAVRLASLLIRRGLLEPDLAARALALQHGVPAALTRHLETRDVSLATHLTPSDAHRFQAIPLGLARTGAVVVCVRDPDQEGLVAGLEACLQRPVTLAVTSAAALTPLLREVYGASPDTFEVELSFAAEAPEELDPFSSGAFRLAALDDDEVQRDPSQQLLSPKRELVAVAAPAALAAPAASATPAAPQDAAPPSTVASSLPRVATSPVTPSLPRVATSPARAVPTLARVATPGGAAPARGVTAPTPVVATPARGVTAPTPVVGTPARVVTAPTPVVAASARVVTAPTPVVASPARPSTLGPRAAIPAIPAIPKRSASSPAPASSAAPAERTRSERAQEDARETAIDAAWDPG
ncbi:MAG: hypothetical protein R3B48_12150 [Kofleriaceae bacterium]